MKKFFAQTARFTGIVALFAALALVATLAACTNPSAPEQYTITFESQGGTRVAPVTAEEGTAVPEPAAPEKANHTFLGWHTAATDGAAFAWPHTLTGNVTLYAQWQEDAPEPPEPYSYTVSFDKNGGDTEANPAAKTVASPATTIDALPVQPTRDGHSFIGWNTAPDGSGSPFTASTTVSAAIRVYAQWQDAAAPVLTGAVAVSGTLQTGQILTAVTDDLGGSGTISYEWQRSAAADETFAPIADAVAAAYTLTAADLDAYIRVTVRRADNNGTVSSDAAGPVALATLPPLSGAVAVTGTAEVGQTLAANTDELGGGGAISYVWERSDSADGTYAALSGAAAASSSYRLAAADQGKFIRVTVGRAENSGTVSSDAAGPVAFPPLAGTVALSGSAYVGQALTANTASLGGSGAISYEWQRSDTAAGTYAAIANAAAATYTLTAADLDAFIRVTVSRANNTGAVSSSPTDAVVLPPLTGTVTVTGTPLADLVLRADTANLGGSGTVSYTWQRGDTATGGFVDLPALAATYTLVATDLNKYIRVTVRREGNSGLRSSDAVGPVGSRTPLTGTAAVTGTALVDLELKADTAGLNGGGLHSYQWERGDAAAGPFAAIAGATGSGYTLVAEDETKFIRVTVGRAENLGTISSVAVGPVGLRVPLTGTVAIAGTAQVGLVLAVNTASLGGSGAISYTWQRADSAGGPFAAIPRATEATYTVAAADLGKYLQVTVSRLENTGAVFAGPTAQVTLQPPGARTITVGFNYGAIAITGDTGTNVIFKTSSAPNSLTLTATADYTDVKWYVDGGANPVGTGHTISLAASDYNAKAHSVTFTGRQGGNLYSQVIPFTVKN
jgi:uncharacterized repeat protein (TIGR02543 family)